MTLSTVSAREGVRRLIQDGAVASGAFNVVRLEDLSDQIPATATPTQTTFLARFEGVNLGAATVFAVPGTLRAYLDGSPVPTVPTADVDTNGNFTLSAAPAAKLLVSYAWQLLTDGDVDSYVDYARSWLREYAAVTQIPDGLAPALVQYAAADACRAIARKCTQASARGGEATENLADLAKSYQASAKDYSARADQLRKSYWARADETAGPAVAGTDLVIAPFQPTR